MQNVTVVPRRPSVASGFMADLLPMVQQQAAEKTAAQEQQQKLHELYLKAILTETDPARRAAAYAQAPPEVQTMMPNPASLPMPPKTPEQMAQDQAAQGSMSAMNAGDPLPVPGQSMNAPPTSLMGRPMPNPTPVSGGSDAPPIEGSGDTVPQRDAPGVGQKMTAWFAQYVTANKRAPSKDEIAAQLTNMTAGDQGLTQASAIDDKRALNAHESAIDLPMVAPSVAEKKASAYEKTTAGGKNIAEVGKLRAETGKIGAETTGLNATNALKARLGAPSPTGAPKVPLEQADPIVRMLVNRKYDPATMRRWKPEEQDAYLGAAMQYDPNLNMQDYPEQFKIKADFASGKSKNNVQSLNTAIGHTYDMWAASNKIDNFNGLPLVNTMVNAAVNKAKMGSGGGKPLVDFNTAATGATQELATLFKGGVGTEGEVHEWRSNVSPNGSKEQRDAAIQQLAHMIGARTEALASNYEKTGRSFYDDQLNARSKVLLQRMGIDPHTFEIVGAGSPAPAAPPPTVTKPKSDPLGIF